MLRHLVSVTALLGALLLGVAGAGLIARSADGERSIWIVTRDASAATLNAALAGDGTRLSGLWLGGRVLLVRRASEENAAQGREPAWLEWTAPTADWSLPGCGGG